LFLTKDQLKPLNACFPIATNLNDIDLIIFKDKKQMLWLTYNNLMF
jgi:hypothetical protein